MRQGSLHHVHRSPTHLKVQISYSSFSDTSQGTGFMFIFLRHILRYRFHVYRSPTHLKVQISYSSFSDTSQGTVFLFIFLRHISRYRFHVHLSPTHLKVQVSCLSFSDTSQGTAVSCSSFSVMKAWDNFLVESITE